MPLVLWSVLGGLEPRTDVITSVSADGVHIDTERPAPVGAELRCNLVDADGHAMAAGLAIVSSVDDRGMAVRFLCLGVDAAVLVGLGASPTSRRAAPPPIPERAPVAPPPLPVVAREPEAPSEPEPARDTAPESEPEMASPLIEPLAVRKPGVIIGIDLGTTNTCAAYVVDGKPKLIPGRTGTNTIPSMINFDTDGRWYVGQRAADRQVLHPLRTVYGSKRLVGRTYRADLAAELQRHFAYPLGEADGQRFGVRINDHVISMDTIAARVLDEVRSTAEAHLGTTVRSAVITVPAYFSEVQRDAVRRAAREANLIVHRIVNEPTAAAVAYGHKQEKGTTARIAVWDFGGGTFDFSIVHVKGGVLEVLATGGDNFAGGTDLDDLLASHLLGAFQNGDFEPNAQQIARLREAAEVAKKALSTLTEHTVELFDFAGGQTLTVEITRAQFDTLAQPLITRTLAIAEQVMAGAGLGPTDIDDVLLVGGSTRIPAVQNAVAALFKRRPSKGINADEAVAMGAALLADEIGTAHTLVDILPMSVGFAAPGQRFVPIVARNSRLPAEQDTEFDADLLGNVTVPLFQGESLDVREAEYLCSVIVEDRALWDNGRVRLKLSFDEHCVMAIDAVDARTGKTLPARTDRTRPVDDILRELGGFERDAATKPPPPPAPPSRVGRALGKLFKMFGR